MKRLTRGLLAATLIVGSWPGTGAEAASEAALWQAVEVTRLPQPVPAPPVVLDDLAGQKVDLRDFRGRVVMLYFWATWCGYCEKELPSMNTLQQELKDQGFTLLLVNLWEKKARVEQTVKEHGYTARVLLDPDGRVSRSYRVTATPTVFLVGRDGSLLGNGTGPKKWTEPQGRALLDALLDAPAPRAAVEPPPVAR